MAKTESILNELNINYLTKAQYDAAKAAGEINEDELYMTPSEMAESGSGCLVVDSTNTTITTDSAKGIAPYNTSYAYTNFDVVSDMEWKEGMLVVFLTTTAVASANRNARVRIGEGEYIPLMGSGNSILNAYSYLTAGAARAFVYSRAYVQTGGLHLLTDSNSDVYLRVYRSSLTSGGTYDADYPILVSRTKDTGITADSYAAVYAQISTDTTKVAYINPTTGKITAPAFKGNGTEITNVNAATVNGHSVAANVPSDAKFTDTTYESKAAASGGTAVSLVTTGEKYTWNNKGTYSKPSGGIPASDLASGVIPTSLPASNTTNTYSASGTAPVSGQAVAAAINALDVSSVGGDGKYISSISETDGKIAATATDLTRNAITYLDQKTYTGILASANTNGSGADFMPITLTPNDATSIWHLKFKIDSSFTRTSDSVFYNASSIVDIYGCGNTYIDYHNWNVIKNASYPPVYYAIIYRSGTATKDMYVGFCLYNTANPTIAGNERTVTISILQTENCTTAFHDTVANTDYTTYYTNQGMNARTNLNICSNGLQETGDSDTINRLADAYYRPYVGSRIEAYKLCMSGDNGLLYPIVTTSGNGTSKAVQTKWLKPNNIWYYNSGTAKDAGAVTEGSVLYSAFPMATALYTFNDTVPAYRDVYLCGEYDRSKDLFKLATTDADGNDSVKSFYTFVPTNSAVTDYTPYFIKGRYYIYVGGTYSSNNYLSLMINHPMYYFDGEKLVPVFAEVATEEKDGLLPKEDKQVLNTIIDIVNNPEQGKVLGASSGGYRIKENITDDEILNYASIIPRGHDISNIIYADIKNNIMITENVFESYNCGTISIVTADSSFEHTYAYITENYYNFGEIGGLFEFQADPSIIGKWVHYSSEQSESFVDILTTSEVNQRISIGNDLSSAIELLSIITADDMDSFDLETHVVYSQLALDMFFEKSGNIGWVNPCPTFRLEGTTLYITTE